MDIGLKELLDDLTNTKLGIIGMRGLLYDKLTPDDWDDVVYSLQALDEQEAVIDGIFQETLINPGDITDDQEF